MITGKSYEERQKISGLSSERADIIIAGALVIQEILRKAKASYLTISGCGLREGLFFHYYDPIYDKNGDKQHDMLRCSVQNYLDTLPITYDFHTKYVTATALAMFDQLLQPRPPQLLHDSECAYLRLDTQRTSDVRSDLRFSPWILRKVPQSEWAGTYPDGCTDASGPHPLPLPCHGGRPR